MKWAGVGPAAFGLVFFVGACVQSVPPPTARAEKVEELECAEAKARSDDVWLQQATVLKVEPQYLWDTCAGTARVTGVKLLVRGPGRASRAQLVSMFHCASARATLGRVDLSRASNDPYGFPGACVDVDVDPEGDNLSVTLRADTVSNNIRLLHRALAFVAEQRAGANR
jgi:hypothetical protein